jgi:hypothetical protein
MSNQKEIKPAKVFAPRSSDDQSNVTLSEIGCPLCGCEMNSEILIKTLYGGIYGPRASVTMRLQCQGDDCKYYERTSVDAYDNDTLKLLEHEALKFEAAIPSIGRWKKSRVSTGKYQYRRRGGL